MGKAGKGWWQNHATTSIEFIFSFEDGKVYSPIVLRICNPIAVQISSLAAIQAVKSIQIQDREHNPQYAMWF